MQIYVKFYTWHLGIPWPALEPPPGEFLPRTCEESGGPGLKPMEQGEFIMPTLTGLYMGSDAVGEWVLGLTPGPG